MKLNIEVEHPEESYIWEVLNRLIQNLPKDRRVKLSLELGEA